MSWPTPCYGWGNINGLGHHPAGGLAKGKPRGPAPFLHLHSHSHILHPAAHSTARLKSCHFTAAWELQAEFCFNMNIYPAFVHKRRRIHLADMPRCGPLLKMDIKLVKPITEFSQSRRSWCWGKLDQKSRQWVAGTPHSTCHQRFPYSIPREGNVCLGRQQEA